MMQRSASIIFDFIILVAVVVVLHHFTFHCAAHKPNCCVAQIVSSDAQQTQFINNLYFAQRPYYILHQFETVEKWMLFFGINKPAKQIQINRRHPKIRKQNVSKILGNQYVGFVYCVHLCDDLVLRHSLLCALLRDEAVYHC